MGNNEFIIFETINIYPLLKAYESFKKGLKEVSSELERDGAIQRFEFTYELTWKILKKILSFKGIDANSPRDVFREAAKQKLIDDPLVWFEFLKKRNLILYAYNQNYLQDIFKSLPDFKKEIAKLISQITA